MISSSISSDSQSGTYRGKLSGLTGVLPTIAKYGDWYYISEDGSNLGGIEGVSELSEGDKISYLNLTGDDNPQNPLNWTGYQKNEDDGSTNPYPQYLQTETDPFFLSSEASNFVTGDKAKLDSIKTDEVVITTTNVVNTTNILQPIPELTINFTELGWHEIRFLPLYDSVATNQGAGFNMQGGTAIYSNPTLLGGIPANLNSTTIFNLNNLTSSFTSGSSPSTANNRAEIVISLKVLSLGTLIPHFRAESTGPITIKEGSYCIIKKLD
jgi:hypothetical protein